MWKCFFKEYFDIYCAGCGGTRMLIALFHLDFYQAFRYNPGMFIFLAIFGCFCFYNIFRLFIGKKLFIPHKNTIYLVIGLLLFYMIFRNIPGFEYLLPVKIK